MTEPTEKLSEEATAQVSALLLANATLATSRDEAEAARDALQARLTAVLALCGSFDPTSGSGRAQAFVGDVRAAASGQEG